jgi:hypothetical protein
MAAEFPHDAKAIGFHKGLDRMANIAECCARPDRRYSTHHCRIGYLNEAASFYADIADRIHPTAIAMPSIDDDAEIDIQNVTVNQNPRAGDAVANDMVQRNASGFGKTVIIERSWDRFPRNDEIVTKSIKLLRRHADSDMLTDHIENFCSQLPSGAHAGEILAGVNCYSALIGVDIHIRQISAWDFVAWRRMPGRLI